MLNLPDVNKVVSCISCFVLFNVYLSDFRVKVTENAAASWDDAYRAVCCEQFSRNLFYKRSSAVCGEAKNCTHVSAAVARCFDRCGIQQHVWLTRRSVY